jgi:hypothetical protein
MKPIEEKLTRLRLAEPPADLRRRVLAAAEAAAAPRESQRRTGAWSGWSEYFWPHPAAWGAVAAVWIVIFTLRMSAPAPEALFARADGTLPDSRSATQFLEYALLQSRLLRELKAEPSHDAAPILLKHHL